MNSVEVKQSKIIKNTVQRKNPIVQREDQSGEQARKNSIQNQHI